MILNFEKMEIFTGISKRECVVTDAREVFADLIYNHGNGIRAHAVAMKIFQSEGAVDYTDEEVEVVKRYAELCTPAFIDAIYKQMGLC